ncbi:hypothetical protein S7711_11142 [Stachybotrys chartarum IBT 7711]|uniref:Peptide N-acetyl-beta-D-glucosaminyl asparaginase amidase A N-terminal domain-containing protein n=1 Tax=Stachybotrys chartarum (strain CBS 109288 / IBT 7711) TaxID=1280523 RepID=A0A084AI87_STACB|nr:hypothetical protein S7711_11142 [Stachybotrys chartarum IBT 7711]
MARPLYGFLALLAATVVQSSYYAPSDLKHQIHRANWEQSHGTPPDLPSQARMQRRFEMTSPLLTPWGAMSDQGPTFEPVLSGMSACSMVLMRYRFVDSHSKPFVTQYLPPPNCPFQRVAINFTASVDGYEHDRTGILYLGDTEVWRTSTAESNGPPGVTWTHWEDQASYFSLWKKPQIFIFELCNSLKHNFTGAIDVTLTATFFKVEVLSITAPPADSIFPISSRRSLLHQGSAFRYPEQEASSNITIPRNTKRAVLTIAATAQADEEFWWSNVPESCKSSFDGGKTQLPALSSFREVRVRIDGEIAGAAWPFPVVFAGGAAPPLHRSVVGIQTFSLREAEIDLSPWLAVLGDGTEHKISLEVVGIDDRHPDGPKFVTVPNHWILSGKVFVWEGQPYEDQSVTRGSPPRVSVSDLDYKASDCAISKTLDLMLEQAVSRQITVEAEILTPGGTLATYAWKQKFNMSGKSAFFSKTHSQMVQNLYNTKDVATVDGEEIYGLRQDYPIFMNFTYIPPVGNVTLGIDADLHQKLDRTVTGLTVFTNGFEPFDLSKLDGIWRGTTMQIDHGGHVRYYQYNNGKPSLGSGEVSGDYSLALHDGDFLGDRPATGPAIWGRSVKVANDTIIQDRLYIHLHEEPWPLNKIVGVSYGDGDKQAIGQHTWHEWHRP